METALAKDGTAFERFLGTFHFGSSIGSGDGDIIREFGIPGVGWFR